MRMIELNTPAERAAFAAKFGECTTNPLSEDFLNQQVDADKLNELFDRVEREAIDDPPYEGAIVVENGTPRSDPPPCCRSGSRERTASMLSTPPSQ